MATNLSTFLDLGGVDLIVRSLTMGTSGPGQGQGNVAGSVGLLYESVTDNITAFAGGGQSSAVQLTSEVNRVNTVATAGDSVKLPVATSGLNVMLINHGANPMQVFGVGTDQVNDAASATGVSQMQNSVCIYVCTIAGKWYCNGLGTGYSGSFETMSAVNGLTAFAGGGQGSATLLTAMMNRVTTVATAADSVKLPVSAVGLQLVVVNAAAANSMNVFPNTGEAINALAVNTAFAVAANKTATFYCVNAGQWHSLLTA